MTRRAFGWRRDLRDVRDYHAEHPAVAKALASEQLHKSIDAVTKGMWVATVNGLPVSSVDLRQHDAPVMDQGSIGSCTGHAGTGLVMLFLRISRGDRVILSPLFTYKATRMLAGLHGDSGAELRDTMRALATVGAVEERLWPHTDGPAWDADPPAIIAAAATAVRSLVYYRLDAHGVAPTDVLGAIKARLAAGHGVMFGTTVYSSFPMHEGGDGVVPMPGPHDRVEGGHALLFVGYDDNTRMLLFRNSWGTSWGERGYGWLPYDYVLQGIASDFWTLTSESDVNQAAFG